MEDPKKRKSVVELVREKFTQIVGKRTKVEENPVIAVDVDPLQADYMPLEEPEDGAVVINAATGAATQHAPWMRVGHSGYATLDQELADFCAWVEPTRKERELRELAVARLKEVVRDSFSASTASCHVFGSYSLDLCLPGSDVDFVVLGSAARTNRPLRRVAATLRSKRYISDILMIEKSRVPIIKYTDAATGIECDVSCDMEGGLKVVESFKRILAHRSMALARPLVLLVKYWLRCVRLHEPFNGGMGSYSVLVLVVSLLQHNRQPDLTLAQALRLFFTFYGTQFNWYTTGISVRDGGRYFRKSSCESSDFYDPNEPWRPALEDPADPDNNIGRASYSLREIRAAMAAAHERLSSMETAADYASGAFFALTGPAYCDRPH